MANTNKNNTQQQMLSRTPCTWIGYVCVCWQHFAYISVRLIYIYCCFPSFFLVPFFLSWPMKCFIIRVEPFQARSFVYWTDWRWLIMALKKMSSSNTNRKHTKPVQNVYVLYLFSIFILYFSVTHHLTLRLTIFVLDFKQRNIF